jgi:hypothetical protein
LELAAGEHGAAPHRTKILGRLHGPATRDPVEASAARTLRPHVAGSCTRTSADPGLHCQDPAGQALHGPSRGPVTQTESDWPGSGQHRQPGRTALRPSCWSRSSAHPGPATARPRWALVLHGLSRGPVTQTESDWPGANHATGLHLTSPGGLDQPGRMRYPGKAVSDSIHHPRSSADPGLPLPGPAGHALHGLSRGPAPRTRPGAGDAAPKLHATSSARAAT